MQRHGYGLHALSVMGGMAWPDWELVELFSCQEVLFRDSGRMSVAEHVFHLSVVTVGCLCVEGMRDK